MSARKPDPVIAAWDRLREANKADYRAYKALDRAEDKARATGFNQVGPIVRIAGGDCIGMTSARRCAEKLPKAEAKAAIDTMRAALADWQQQRRKVGLAPLDAARRRTYREWQAAMKAMGTTRATTAAGVILKMKLIAKELRDGRTGFGEAIQASAIRDLSRIGRRSR